MKISSDLHLLAIDRHTRVTAGPGAGKTYWLVSHIRNVLTRSRKLHANSKVAVISYTNVAADQLRYQLGVYASRADVSTIHSFLYRNVVRPYVHLIHDASGNPVVNVTLLDGHDEHHVNHQHLSAWLKNINLPKITALKEQFELLKRHISTIHWRQGECLKDWQLRIKTDYGLGKKTKEKLTVEALLEYKQQYWGEGKIDHDDVLYFAFAILSEYEIIRQCLSAQFQFVFIDEFQDTVPAQTQIVRWLAEAGSTVVVIGDPEQAIFQFAGAAPEHFQTFNLPELDKFEITSNRRSTQAIISLLNHMRADGLMQECHSAVEGNHVQLLVGPVMAAAEHASSISGSATPLMLARNQRIVDELIAGGEFAKDDVWSELEEIDSTRCRLLKSVCVAIVLARTRRFETSIAALLHGIRHNDGSLKDPFRAKQKIMYTSLDRQAMAVTILETLLGKRESLDASTVRETYDDISEVLSKHFSGLSLSKIMNGKKFATMADRLTMKRMTDSVPIEDTDEVRNIRTIHRAKGKEEECVLVCLHSPQGEKRLRHLTNPKTPSDEEQRLTYVAASRARNLLLFAVPELSSAEEELVRNIGLDVVRLA
jgi:DNA helicase II / ATP-dependent DNA helicase PcrA